VPHARAFTQARWTPTSSSAAIPPATTCPPTAAATPAHVVRDPAPSGVLAQRLSDGGTVVTGAGDPPRGRLRGETAGGGPSHFAPQNFQCRP